MPYSATDRNRLLLGHWMVLVAGALAGVFAAFILSKIPIDYSAQLLEAKRLGIVSKTVLAGYPKSRDVLGYALFATLPVACSLSFWLFWSRGRRSDLAELLQRETASAAQPPSRTALAAGLLAIILLIKFNINNFYEPAGGWAFLGEEGQFLADAQILLSGGDYARDFLCLYGPLVVYPLAWSMKLFGPSILVGRFYTYLLTVASAFILVTLLNWSIRNRTLFIVATLVFGALFIGGGGRINATMMRVLLGFLPLMILYRDRWSASRLAAPAAGALLGVSLLFSQEVGLCALLATGLFLALESYRNGSWRLLLRHGGLLLLGCLAVLVPMLVYFQRQGALARFFDSLYGYPKLVTLGYGSLPFPGLSDWLSAPLGEAYFPYWIMAVYVALAISLLVQFILGRRDREIGYRAALLLFGLLLFRAALGRSDESHYFFALPPALLLATVKLDDAVAAFRSGRRALFLVLLVSLLLLFGSSRVLRENLLDVFSELGRFPSKFSVQQRGAAVPSLPRAGIFFDAETAKDLGKIDAALKRYTKPADPVLFFPNEAAYYFVFNRPVPSRYVHSYFAVTSAHRREMVAELERSRPPVVVYTLDNWRIDDITEDIQVPEVVRYLKERYVLAEDLGNMLILRRSEGGGAK